MELTEGNLGPIKMTEDEKAFSSSAQAGRIRGADLNLKPPRYVKPRLVSEGDIRAITLGGSPGAGDSGNAGTEMPPGDSLQPLGGEGSGFDAPDSSGPSDSGGSDQGSGGEGSGFFTP